jgi:hypothetical protein
MSIAALTASNLAWYEGKHISDICLTGFHRNANHCAHFVSHALELAFGYTCAPESDTGWS